MKTDLLSYLVCSDCSKQLTLLVRKVDGAEVMEGSLTCQGCARTFPIVGGIPRFVEKNLDPEKAGNGRGVWVRVDALLQAYGSRQEGIPRLDRAIDAGGFSRPDCSRCQAAEKGGTSICPHSLVLAQ